MQSACYCASVAAGQAARLCSTSQPLPVPAAHTPCNVRPDIPYRPKGLLASGETKMKNAGALLALIWLMSTSALAQPVGQWQSDNWSAGLGVTLNIQPDGRYQKTLWRLQLGVRSPLQTDTGIYRYNERQIEIAVGAHPEVFDWSILQGARESSLLLKSQRTNWHFYSADATARQVAPHGQTDCGTQFSECISGRTSYNQCSAQLLACRGGR